MKTQEHIEMLKKMFEKAALELKGNHKGRKKDPKAPKCNFTAFIGQKQSDISLPQLAWAYGIHHGKAYM